MQKHLCCAAAEMPLRPKDRDALWLQSAPAQTALKNLCDTGELLQSALGDEYVTLRKRPQRHVDLRGQGESYSIEDKNGQIIGTVDALRAFKETHPGAIYLHQGQSFEITDLDSGSRTIIAKKCKKSWFTRIRSQKQTDILEVVEHKQLCGTYVYRGKLRIIEHITGYEKRSVSGNRLLAVIPLNFPPFIFETEGLWIVIPDSIRHILEEDYIHFMGAIHALEHAAIGLLPLLVMADRNDFGGISTPLHPALALPAVFIYDALPGGAGLCTAAFAEALTLFQNTFNAITHCNCEDGCPSCVHSPKCGSGNRPISKIGAQKLLQCIFTGESIKNPVAHMVLPHDSTKHEKHIKKDNNPLHYVVFDVETRRSAAEVGGWHKAKDMGVSVAVLYDSKEQKFYHFSQEKLADLFVFLQKAELVIGFNNSRFDYAVLQPFTPFTLKALPTLDLLDVIKKRLNYRVSLGNVASATLNSPKSADGLMALRWWKEGKIEEITEYCQQDVDITKKIYEYGLTHGYVLFTNKAGKKVRCPVDFKNF